MIRKTTPKELLAESLIDLAKKTSDPVDHRNGYY